MTTAKLSAFALLVVTCAAVGAGGETVQAPATATASTDDVITVAADQAHRDLFIEDRYPSAQKCRTCHTEHYQEWSISQHAYAQLSPVFNAMQAKIFQLTNGTNGDFCIRCHTPVGMNIGEPVFMSNLDRNPVSREGVTCVVCHRMNRAYGKVSGRLALIEGDIHTPVHGPTGNEELKRVLANPDRYKVVTRPEEQGRRIHADVVPFFELTSPGFCGGCHDVNLVNGFRLEEAFSEYKISPAAKRGDTCQDCHMGKAPGLPSGYRQAPAAVIGGVPTRVRKRTNHSWVGPDHSVIHPALFPHNPGTQKLATLREWLLFDDDAGWGTDAFEDNVASGQTFPERWSDAEDRYEARELLDQQHRRLAEIGLERAKLLRVGYLLGKVVVEPVDNKGLRFRVQVKNGTDGHNVPTGFSAERLVFLQVRVTDAAGEVVFQSGDLDPNGDVRDSHSTYVHKGRLPLDKQLFSLQSRFLTRNIRGGEREQVLPINQSLDPLPFIRPEVRSTILLGRPLEARIHKKGIEPLGDRWAQYEVKHKALTGDGPYRINVKLIAGMVPINLIHEIQDVSFDYGLSAKTIADRILKGHIVLWERDLTTDSGARGEEGREVRALLATVVTAGLSLSSAFAGETADVSSQPIPLQTEQSPNRPKPIVELGNPFLAQGLIGPGFTLPTGATWQPALLVFGSYRSAMQTFDTEGGSVSEWSNRLDLFANLTLTGTERVLLGLRPLNRTSLEEALIDGEDGVFTGYQFGESAADGWRENWNLRVQTLFFEGDFGEIFPGLDRADNRALDIGFSVGRQPLFFQEGLLIDDSVDAFGITRNTLRPSGTSNVRLTGLFGWGNLHRDNGQEDRQASLYGLFTEVDMPTSTLNFDLAYVHGRDSSLHGGFSAVQRIAQINTALRALFSLPFDKEAASSFLDDPGVTVGRGTLLFAELSWTPTATHDLLYLNGFGAFGNYSAIARDPLNGGGLARTGILFASAGVGGFGAALDARPHASFGGAIGYQKLFHGGRRQLVGELGLRSETFDNGTTAAALGARYQQALGRRLIVRVDGFTTREERFGGYTLSEGFTIRKFHFGGRLELLVKF